MTHTHHNAHTRVESCFWTCICFLCLWSYPLFAADHSVLLTTGPDYYPLTDIRNPDGGRATQIVTKVFQRLGKEVKIEWLPWERGYQMTKAGRYQATFPYLKTKEREADFLYSDAFANEESFLWTRSGSSLSLDMPSTFKGTTLCSGVGYASTIEEILRPRIARKEIDIFRPRKRESCIIMLAAGRVDAVSGLREEFLPVIRAHNLTDKVTYSVKPIKMISFHLIAPKTRPGSRALIENFNRALKQMQLEGTL